MERMEVFQLSGRENAGVYFDQGEARFYCWPRQIVEGEEIDWARYGLCDRQLLHLYQAEVSVLGMKKRGASLVDI